jgi:TPR repeat protein
LASWFLFFVSDIAFWGLIPILTGHAKKGFPMKTKKLSQIYPMLLLLFLISIFPCGCSTVSMPPSESHRISGLCTQAPGGADAYIVVDCKLPGQIRQLGRTLVDLSQVGCEKTTAKDCANRGGVFAMPGQPDYTNKALMVWLPSAEAGDMEAQYYVGEIYQRGLDVAPKYSRAAEWFRKAAEQRYAKAQMNLAYLYENGMGVEKNPQRALLWYRKSTGLGDSITLNENVSTMAEPR